MLSDRAAVGPRPVPGLGARHLGAVGAGLAGLRRLASRRCRSIPPPRSPSSPKRAGGTPTGTERWIGTAGSSSSISWCRRASRSGRQIDEMLAAELARAGVIGARADPGVGGLHRAGRRGRVRGGFARLVRRRPEPGSLPVLALLAVPAAWPQQRLLPESRGRSPDGGSAPRARPRETDRALPPPATDLPRRRARDLPRELDSEVRLRPRRPRRHDVAARACPASGRGPSAGSWSRRPAPRLPRRGRRHDSLRRCGGSLLAVPTLFGIVVIVFLLVHLAPGTPVSGGGEALRRPDRARRRGVAAALRARPADPRAFRRRGSPGPSASIWESPSWTAGRSGERIREALPHTLLLNGVALILALAIAIPLGVVAGGHPEGALDRVSGVALFALYSTPTFWMALLLQSLFAVQLGWLPLYGVASDRRSVRARGARATGSPTWPCRRRAWHTEPWRSWRASCARESPRPARPITCSRRGRAARRGAGRCGRTRFRTRSFPCSRSSGCSCRRCSRGA